MESSLKTFRPTQNLFWLADMMVSKMERDEMETLANEAEQRHGRANLTLDPDTANPFLILAGDQRGVRRGGEWALLPNNPERFDVEPCVLGLQGFTTGSHCWEVEFSLVCSSSTFPTAEH
ncbi:E3 ubiquitin-protein ligase TRIM11-like isoform X2 [Apus apus]|uniref:E3 ubiquitin-protein ligase TRIM11-like isoform X2 n=1 Tax=Apus apus TaxID=8895 RepID=UPI0021F81690|nr:E3 ubiquitin-protein ligase TRIM11-like isoform X2 [Apus apus]